MTETDISKVLIEGEYATIMGVKYKRVEEPKTPVEEAYKEWWGEYPVIKENGDEWDEDDVRWDAFRYGWWAALPKAVPPDEPECDEKDNSKFMIMDEVVEWNEDANTPNLQKIMDKMAKKYQAQKLYNRLYDELGYDVIACENVCEMVEDWLPKEQNADGSQNVNTELLVDGFNHCLEKIKGMLR